MTKLDSSKRSRSIFLILFGFGWMVFFGAFFGAPIRAAFQPSGWPDPVWVPSLVILILIPAAGLVIAAVGIYPFIAWWRVTRPEITIDKTALAVGESVTVGYSQIFKRRSEVRGIQLALVMRESAYHHAGRNSHTYHHEETAVQFDRPGQSYEAGDTLAFSQTLEIPKSGMHTFHGGNNSIDWELRVNMDIAGWPDYGDAFAIEVLPKPAGSGQ